MSTHESADDARNARILIWVNGELRPRAEATVSVYDSGFLLGDGMWEGLRLHAGRWAFLDDHLDRLFASCLAVGIDIGLDRAGVVAALEATRRANGMTDHAHARLMVTRGVKARPFQHPRLSRSGPTVVIIAEHSTPDPGVLRRGARLVTVPQVRGLPMAQDAKYNSHSKLNCVLACLQADAAGADEALMLDPHGFVNTTNACNFFVARGGEVWTSTGNYCMNGVTRAKIIGLCRRQGIVVRERDYSLFDAYGADEAFLTGTFGGVTPVASIDHVGFGPARGDAPGAGDVPDAGTDGTAAADARGPITRRLQAAYRELVAADVAAAGSPGPPAAAGDAGASGPDA